MQLPNELHFGREALSVLIRLAALVLMLVASAQAATGVPEDNALIDAAFSLNLKGVRAALAQGANPNVKRLGRSPFGGMILTPVLLSGVLGEPAKDSWVQASANKDEWIGIGQPIDQTRTEIAKALFDAGATLARLDATSRSVLWSTCIRMGNVGLIQLLIDHGAYVTNKIFPEDVTPTELALMEGQQTAYQLLVSRGGAPVDDASSAQFALLAAAERGDIGGMERAIKDGAQINKVIDDQTALMVAVAGYIYTEAQLTTIKWLLDHGADPNVGSRFDLPLHRFVIASSFTLNELSRWREDDLMAIRPSSRQDFDVHRVRALNREVLIRLLKAGAKMSTKNNYGWTPLHYAARLDNFMAAEILILEGAKILLRDAIDKAPVDYAVSGAMIRFLQSNAATSAASISQQDSK
jgi:ankyrin repeat protein